MVTNTAALENGFNKAKKIIEEKIGLCLIKQANILAMKAHDLYHSPKMGFTGNTWTGTAVGVYVSGILIYFITTKMIADMPSTVRRKLTSGERAFLESDYNGIKRSYLGLIETDKQHSEYDAIQFLQNHNPLSKYAITVVNGSEYASYIEDEMNGDVLIGTYHYANRLRAVDIINS